MFFVVGGKVKKAVALISLSLMSFSCAQMVSGYQEPYTIKQGETEKTIKVEKEEKKGKAFEERKEEKVLYEKDYEEKAKEKEVKKAGNISIHFDDITISELLNEVFYKILGVSYLAPADLNQRVSVHINHLTKDEVITYMQEILSLYGLGLSVDKGRLVVLPSGRSPVGDNLSALVYSPENVSASSLSQAISTFISPSGKIIAQQRLLVIIDYREKLSKLKKLLTEIDTPFYGDKKIAFIKTKVDASQIRDNVRKILKLLGKADADSVIDSLEKEGIVIVVSKDPVLFNDIKRWIEVLEETSSGTKREIYIYRLNFLDAESTAELLNTLGIFEEGIGISSQQQAQTEAPRSTQEITKIQALPPTDQKPKQTTPETQKKEEMPPAVIEEKAKSEAKEEKKIVKVGNIVADKSTNTLIIKATPIEFEVIRSLLRELDVVPKQVLIEMVIAEVSLGKGLQYGVEGLLKGFLDSSSFTIGTSFGLAPQADTLQGFKTIIFNKNNDIRGILNFLASKTSLKVLSAPHILVKDNEEAKIEVGAEVPILTQQIVPVTGGTLNVQNMVQYRTTGVILKVRPTVSADNSVTLKITQEVSDAVKNTVQPELTSPLITKRSASTTLILRNDQVGLLGGIIQNRLQRQKSGVPLLSDIPGLGILFSNESVSSSNTELILLIKASVITTPEEGQGVKTSFENKLKHLKDLLKEE
ncbi:type II and III secretion system protein [Hydrogenobacter thermophilus TK-6]|uniref:General secretion pathway protein D n=1 Tax=Hydrogenobacter thermophilus (strain DSM 6534 / IAM 12695 / TK-6) TaxID=608538 RepID=D3DGE2_HYDTT|nr:secretin N-terminal domain-containing protein [Hydrogenobacter thermophilus]ADO44830.1 type II and III secretion system protein [Hydrogenobacter thermophilus TK-6]BAI68894.1 general secretion pathway protein D [Hydrogenobacter thermophilus TK-6]